MSVAGAVGTLRQEFRELAHTTRAEHESWTAERKRNLRLLDVIQSGALTSGLETETRLERIELRLSRLEEKSA